jgi:hypothetical protein
MSRLDGRAAGMPGLMRAGLLVVVVGGGADVLHHALPQAALGLAPYLGHDGGTAHALTFAGMVVTMLGVFTRRLTSAPKRAIPDHEQLRRTEHAHR